jgi:hypothetical protein
MPKHSGPSKLSYEELWGQVAASVQKADAHAANRLDRIWNTVTAAHFAADVHPIDQVLAVLCLLENAGIHTPGIDAAQIEEYRQKIPHAKSVKQ